MFEQRKKCEHVDSDGKLSVVEIENEISAPIEKVFNLYNMYDSQTRKKHCSKQAQIFHGFM